MRKVRIKCKTDRGKAVYTDHLSNKPLRYYDMLGKFKEKRNDCYQKEF